MNKQMTVAEIKAAFRQRMEQQADDARLEAYARFAIESRLVYARHVVGNARISMAIAILIAACSIMSRVGGV